MKKALVGFVMLSAGFAIADLRDTGGAWTLESEALTVTVKNDSAWMSVLDKRTGTLWKQEDPEASASEEERVHILYAATPPVIDARDNDWSRRPIVWLPWTGENGEKNCSGGVRLMWDEQRLYLYAGIRDDNVAFGGDSTEKWWEADSVELWLDSIQVGLHLAPEGREVACDPGGKPYEGAEIAVRRISKGPLPGYAVELSMPLKHLPILRSPQAGLRFRFAVGLNDADPKPGETVKRAAQGYYPHTWVHSSPQTFAVAVLCDAEGNAPARNKENDRSGSTGMGRAFDMKPGSFPDTLTYQLEVNRGQPRPLLFSVSLALCQHGEALEFTLKPADSGAPMKSLQYPETLYPDRDPESYFLCFPDYSDGRYIPVTDPIYRNRWLGIGDLPFVAVTDGTQGLMLLALTPWDVSAASRTRKADEQKCGFPALHWRPVKGRAGTMRRMRLHFFSKGGHVRACKLYREVAKKDGYVRTLRQKAEVNPNVNKLIGAVNWWGPRDGLTFVQEAKALGVRKGLLSKHTGISGREDTEAIETIKSLGWLNSEYDCYEDMDDSPEISSHKGPLDKHGVIKADGEYMTAWVSRDKDMNPIHTFMKRCTAMMVPSAKITIPPLLAEYPHNARFIDVTTATSLKECYHPDHPLTRAEDVVCRRQLLSYVANELKLVTGGEHGRFWNADILDYHEGMMGGGKYSWHAGHLREPEKRENIGEDYLKYGINPALRVPLYELVFHDCVVDYCYWGATTDYLHAVAPDITDRKVALNILYGTPPIMWTHRNGLNWAKPEGREKMLTIYRSVCVLHEAIGMEELIAHEFLTPDRMVQRSRFADGTCCTVNFSTDPYTLTNRLGRPVVLHQNDYYAVGDRIELWRVTTENASTEPDVFVHTDDALFIGNGTSQVPAVPGVESSGKLWLGLDGPNRAHIVLYPGSSLSLQPGVWHSSWKEKTVATLLLDPRGKPATRGPVVHDGCLKLPVSDEISRYLVLVGPEAEKPDVDLVDVAVFANGQPLTNDRIPEPGANMTIRATVENKGLVTARELKLVVYMSGIREPFCELRTPPLAPEERRVVSSTPFAAGRADGQRQINVQIADADNCCLMGNSQAQVEFQGPVQPNLFPFRRTLEIAVPDGDATGMIVEQPFSIDRTVAAGNLRVAFPGGRAVPAQFEASADGAFDGMLVFRLPGGLAAGSVPTEVLGAEDVNSTVLPMALPFVHDGADLRLGTYCASLADGQLKNIKVFTDAGEERLLIHQIWVSSKETGWSKEPGKNEAFELQHAGPVRLIYYLRRKLDSGHLLERQFRFYADRFEIFSRCTPNVAMLTRTYFAMPGQATKQSGGSVAMDGAGQSEGFGDSGGTTSEWYAVYSPEFRFACIALTAPGQLIWWDSGTFGQSDIAYSGGGDWEKRLFILSAKGATDAQFAEETAVAARKTQ